MSTFQTIGRRAWLIAGLLWSSAGVLGAEVPGRLPPVPAPLGDGTRPDLNGPPAVRMAQAERPGGGLDRPSGRSEAESLLPPAGSILDPNVNPIDLNTALQLAGVQNPELPDRAAAGGRGGGAAATGGRPVLAQHQPGHELRHAHRRLAAVQRQHPVGQPQRGVRRGRRQRDRGRHGEHPRRAPDRQRRRGGLRLSSCPGRSSANASSPAWRSGTRHSSRTTLAYSELLRAEGRRAIALQVRDEARSVARLTAAYAASGQGRQADANRAATELASARPSSRPPRARCWSPRPGSATCSTSTPRSGSIRPTPAVVPQPIVPDPMPVAELIALALLQRPELAERRAAIREALLALEGAKVLPFSPTILLGFSAGGFGGGSNLVRPIFGGFGGRTDFDVIAYWTIQQPGRRQRRADQPARSRLGVAQYQEIAMLDRVRAEVAEAYARTHARYAQIGTTEQAVRTGLNGFREDLERIRGTVGLPIEVLDSLRLLARARHEYLNAIVDYNEAQFELLRGAGPAPGQHAGSSGARGGGCCHGRAGRPGGARAGSRP